LKEGGMGKINETPSYPVKILLVEDDSGQAGLTLKVFRDSKTPFDINRVRDGEEALTYLRKEGTYSSASTPDMILLDINMPKMNGFEVLDVVKNDPLLKGITVFVLTCSNSDFDKITAYEKKANFYIVKPTELSEFFEVVKYVEHIWLTGIKHAKP
jgi:chemotaxis family two-component system response regulator Rcp1